jgi:hypothetical protein
LCIAAASVWLSGCGGSSTEHLIPTSEVARRGLETALTSWKKGEPLRTIDELETPVNVVDARWRERKKLEAFEIIAESPGDPHPTFTVKMRFAQQKNDEETKYIVTGVSPIVVFREEDYNVGGM